MLVSGPIQCSFERKDHACKTHREASCTSPAANSRIIVSQLPCNYPRCIFISYLWAAGLRARAIETSFHHVIVLFEMHRNDILLAKLAVKLCWPSDAEMEDIYSPKMKTLCIDCTKYDSSDVQATALAFACQSVYLNFVALLTVRISGDVPYKSLKSCILERKKITIIYCPSIQRKMLEALACSSLLCICDYCKCFGSFNMKTWSHIVVSAHRHGIHYWNVRSATS